MSESTEKQDQGAPTRPLGMALRFLKDYKELFAAIAFFIGGTFWILGYFATKEELKNLKDVTAAQNQTWSCLLKTHVQLLEGEQDLKIARDDLVTVMGNLQRQTPTRRQPTEFDVREISRLQQQKVDIQNQLAAAEKSVADAKRAIMFRECDK